MRAPWRRGAVLRVLRYRWPRAAWPLQALKDRPCRRAGHRSSSRPRGLRARGCGRHRPYREWPRRLCHIPVHRPGSSGHPRALDQAREVCGFPPRCAGEPDRCPPCAGTAMMLYFRSRSLCFPLLPSHRGKGRPERSYTAGLFRQYVSGTGPCLRAVVTKNPPLLQQSSGFWDGRELGDSVLMQIPGRTGFPAVSQRDLYWKGMYYIKQPQEKSPRWKTVHGRLGEEKRSTG